MSETPQTANDLTAAIKELCADYKMDSFEVEFRDAARACGASEESLKDGTFTPLQLIAEGRKEQYAQFVKCVEQLDRKYQFQDFHLKCSLLRTMFQRQREGYLFSNMLAQCSVVLFMSPAAAEIVFMEWLDGAVAVESPKPIMVEYEDLDGTMKHVQIVDKADEITEDYVECRPLNYFSGQTPYDSFTMRFYYCPKQERWVAIPINLIRTLAAPDSQL